MKAAILIGLLISSGSVWATEKYPICIQSLINTKPALKSGTDLGGGLELTASQVDTRSYNVAIFKTGKNELVRISQSKAGGVEFLKCEARGSRADINSMDFQINMPHSQDPFLAAVTKLKLMRGKQKNQLVRCEVAGARSCWGETVQFCEKLSPESKLVTKIINELIHERVKKSPDHVLKSARVPKIFSQCQFKGKYIANYIDVELRRRRDKAEGPAPRPEPRAIPVVPALEEQSAPATAQ